jgi:hypothetical protein
MYVEDEFERLRMEKSKTRDSNALYMKRRKRTNRNELPKTRCLVMGVIARVITVVNALSSRGTTASFKLKHWSLVVAAGKHLTSDADHPYDVTGSVVVVTSH